jgi:AraC-like DNA-binding protein
VLKLNLGSENNSLKERALQHLSSSAERVVGVGAVLRGSSISTPPESKEIATLGLRFDRVVFCHGPTRDIEAAHIEFCHAGRIFGAPPVALLFSESPMGAWLLSGDATCKTGSFAKTVGAKGTGVEDILMISADMPFPLPKRQGLDCGIEIDHATLYVTLLRDLAQVLMCASGSHLKVDSVPPMLCSSIASFAISLISLMLIEINDALTVGEAVGSARVQLSKVLREIVENYTDPDFSARHVAAELGLSVRYVHALLERTGIVFTDRVNSLRLESAYSRLISPSEAHTRISEIAFDVGFNDQPYFNRVFKARFGVTPGQLRTKFVGGRNRLAHAR